MKIYYVGRQKSPVAFALARGMGVFLSAGWNEVDGDAGARLVKTYPKAFIPPAASVVDQPKTKKKKSKSFLSTPLSEKAGSRGGDD